MEQATGAPEQRGPRAKGHLAGSSREGAAVAAATRADHTAAQEGTAAKGKARRRPASVASHLDFASFPRTSTGTSSSPSELPSADSLLSQPLPSSEPALYDFLRRARTTHPGVPATWLAWFHAHPRIAPFASTRTYRLLLHGATATTDKGLVRSLLSEMHERGVPLDDETRRVLLRGYLRGGEDERAFEVARRLGRVGKRAVLEATKPRDLGEVAKGRGDAEVLWKGWATRERDKRAEEARKAALEAVKTEVAPQGTYKRRRHRSFAAAPASSPLPSSSHPRQTLVPARPAALSGSDVGTLVERLVQERRLDEAHALTETWLTANRPAQQDARPSPSFPLALVHRTAAAYHSTALVLMNTLLKSLFFERPSLSSVHTFIDAFTAKHSAPFPAFPLTPNAVTLRLLVSGCLGVADAWDRATSLVDWYGYRFGLPPTDGSLTGRRRYFVPPSRVEGARVGAAKPSLGVVSGPHSARHPVLVPPHAVVAPDVAVLLLRHAVDQYERGTLGYGERVKAVRRWWAGFDRRGSDVWGFWKTRELEKRAKKVGLLTSKAAGSSAGRAPEGKDRVAGGGRGG